MDARLQRRVQRYGWDKAAPHYERYWAEQLLPAQDRLLELADLQPGDRVLEVAAGTGLVTLRVARAVGPTGKVLATDISEAMVTALEATAAAADLVTVTVRRADAEELGVEPESFDAALCALGLMYVPDPLAATREMARAVRPGGRVVAAVWGARSKCGWAEIFPIVERRVASEVCPLFFQLGTGDALQLTMEAADLTDIRIDRIATTLRYDSAEDACGAAFAGGPVALAYSRFDEPTRQASTDWARRASKPTSGTFRSAWSARSTGRRCTTSSRSPSISTRTTSPAGLGPICRPSGPATRR
jgi:ubiquinone/menaquinone biosynthesis C-methylase UbiE